MHEEISNRRTYNRGASCRDGDYPGLHDIRIVHMGDIGHDDANMV